MIITCEECSTSFNLDEKFLKPSGSKVRCSNCQHIFTAFPIPVPEEKEAPPVAVPADEVDAAVEEEEVAVDGIGDDQPDGTGELSEADTAAEPPESGSAVEAEPVQEETGLDEEKLEDLDFDMGVVDEPQAEEGVLSDEKDADLESADTAAPEIEADLAEEPGAVVEESPMPEAEEPQVAEDVAEVAASDDLDLSGLDEALDMEVEPEAEEMMEDLAEDLDLDLDLDMEPEAGELPAAEDAEEVVASDDLDLSGLDEALGLDVEPEAETVEADLAEDLDLDLDMEMEPEVGDLSVAEDAEEVAATDDLDLSGLDEALDLEGESEAEAAEADLSEDLDLELDLEMEPEAREQPVEAATDGDTASDELDMSDIMLDLESEDDTQAPAEELDLDLDLELDAGEGASEDVPEVVSDDLNLAGFEETLEMDAPPVLDTGDTAVEDLSDDLDLELDLEMEDGAQLEAESAADDAVEKSVDEDIEDLDFELDMEFEPGEDLEAAELEVETDDTEDLDLSDIEEMLEVKDGDEVGSGIPDLEGGDQGDIEVEKWKAKSGEKGLMEETAEIDLTDIQLDADGPEDATLEDQELELDLDIDDGASADAKAISADEPPELDISHFEDLEMEGKPDASDAIGEGDIELEFEIDGDTADTMEEEGASDMEEPTHRLETIAIDASDDLPEEPETEADKKEPEKEKKKKKKKVKPVGKSSAAKPALVVLLLLVVAFGAVIVLDRFGMEVPFVTEYVKQVPYVNQLMQQEVKKTGEITTSNISSKFVDNAKHGKFFVITGMVKNEFPEGRRFIQLTGRLFSTGKVMVKEEMVYCGNTISDIKLAQMELADITKKLNNRFGDKKSNFNVKPGQQLPFMVVFSNLPQDLEEFTIEISGSFPVQQ